MIEKGMGKNWKWLAVLFAVFGTMVGLFGIVNTDPQATNSTIKKIPEDFEAWTHQIEPNTMLQIIIIMLKCRAGIVRRIYKNAVFDTNRKSLLRHISAEKGLK